MGKQVTVYGIPRVTTPAGKEAKAVFVTDPEDMLRTFLELTQQTCPYGKEDKMYGDFLKEDGWLRDAAGNYHKVVGSGSTTVFTAHLDTASSFAVQDVTHTIDQQMVVSSDAGTILGADDRVGVAIILYMIAHNVPGRYVLFVGEERGGIGSSAVAADELWKEYSRMISFDRRGYEDIITYQGASRCCSDEFAEALADKIASAGGPKMSPCDGGIFTDSANFTDIIPECTNLSVGYGDEHTMNEWWDSLWTIWFANTMVQIDWESLPTARDMTVKDDLYSQWQPMGHWENSVWIADRPTNDDFDDYEWDGMRFVRVKGGTSWASQLEEDAKWDVYMQLNDTQQALVDTVGDDNFTTEDLIYIRDKGWAPAHLVANWQEAIELLKEIRGE